MEEDDHRQGERKGRIEAGGGEKKKIRLSTWR